MIETAIEPKSVSVDRALTIARRHAVNIALVAILIIAAIPRFTNVNWDDGNYLQPDERFIVMVTTSISWPHSVGEYFDSAHSPLNPYNNGFTSYIYGDVLIFLGKLGGNILGKNDYGNVHIAGRELSAIFDLFTVLLVFLVGRRLFGPVAGLLGAALLAFTTLDIQLAHFYASDSFVATFCLATFYFVLRADERNRWRDAALAGFMAGAAVATKLSALPVFVMLFVPFAEQLRRGGWRSVVRRPRPGLPAIVGLGISLVVCVWTFRVLQPYAFLGPSPFSFRLDPRFTADVHSWNQVQNGIADIPPSIQWAGRAPILFMTKNMVLWGMGPLLGVAALLGLAVGAFRVIAGRTWPSAIYVVLVGWPAFHIVYYGVRVMKTMRYWLPAYPFLVLLAAGLLVEIGRRGKAFPRFSIPFRLSWIPAILVLAGTIFSGLAFTSIYHRPITRLAASEWIYNNIPAGATRTSESWDDALPYPLPNYPGPDQYGMEELDLYGDENAAKLANLMSSLQHTDYIFESSNRLYGSIPRIPERYPMATAYYQMLFSGELGFELVKTFTSRPSLFGITLNDDGAEEAFTVYDHPKVLIFKKTANFNAANVERKLALALANGGDIVNIRPVQQGKNLLEMTTAERIVQQAGGTWSAIFDRGDLANRHPVRVWWLALQLMALAGLGLSWRVFRGLPDRGYAISKTLGFLCAGYVAWLLPSLHVIDFGRNAVLIGLGATLLVSMLTVGRRWRAFIHDLVERWPQIVAAEIIFTVAFFVFVWFRSKNPDLWHPYRGGEKPMEFAFFNAVIKSTHFPPYDPWFAGGYINYYYYGYALFASLTRLTGVIPAVAFNLAVPTCFALLVLNSWCFVSSALQALLRPVSRAGKLAPLALGLLGPLFVAVMGNLDMAREIGQGAWDYPDVNHGAFGAAGDIVRGVYRAIFARHPIPSDSYWAASRIVDGTINEFPYFTMLFADFHPHLMALPFTAGALVMALGIVLSRRWPDGDVTAAPEPSTALFAPASDWRARLARLPKEATWDRLLLTGVAALVTGTLFPLNTWDFPTYLAITAGAFMLLELLPTRSDDGSPLAWDFSFAAVRRAGLWTAATVIGGRLLFWPYFAHYETPNSGFDRWTQSATRPGQYLIIHGVLLFFVVSYLLTEIGSAATLRWRLPLPSFRQIKWRPVMGIDGTRTAFAQIDFAEADLAGRPMVIAAVVFAIAAAISLVQTRITPLLLALLGLSALAAWQKRREPVRLLLIALTGVAFALSLAVERYALHGDVGRMNTVFKFYLQIWMLLGLVAAIGTAMVVLRARHHIGRVGRIVWSVAGAFLIVAGLVYPALATPSRLEDRFNPLPRTLNGMAYMASATYDDNPHDDNNQIVSYSLAGDDQAITWLQDNIAGSPVVLEGNTPLYRWGSRVSVYTGLPDVIGWDWHETQQRMGYSQLIDIRKADVQTMLGDAVPFAQVAPLLDKYHVQLIYIGALERAYYDPAGLKKFADAAAAGQLTMIYNANGVTIYRVAQTSK